MNMEERLNYVIVIQMLANGLSVFVVENAKLPEFYEELENFLCGITLTAICELCTGGLVVYVWLKRQL